jgi:hypothetical protein
LPFPAAFFRFVLERVDVSHYFEFFSVLI